jgi:hypothetical protein
MPEHHHTPPRSNLVDALDQEMQALVRVDAAELAECLRQVLSDWYQPESEGYQLAAEALARYDRQQTAADPPPWLLRRR